MEKRKLKTYGESYRMLVEGSWGTDGATGVLTVKGKGFSVARSGVGLAEITFDEIYQDLESFECSLGLAAGDDKIAQRGVHTAPASPTKGKQQVRCWDISAAAVAEWPASNADNRVSFKAVLLVGRS